MRKLIFILTLFLSYNVYSQPITPMYDPTALHLSDLGKIKLYSLSAADGDPCQVVYVDNDGNVGIGTINPASGYILDVNGILKVKDIVASGPEIDARWFGAIDDGITDSTDAINAALIYAERKSSIVVLPYQVSGVYKISDTLFVGTGDRLSGVTLRGVSMGIQSAGGITIDASSFLDRPAIAIQGARFSCIENLIIVGGNTAPYEMSGKETDIESDYITEGATYGRYNPYAGIAIDPYKGGKPASDFYPGTYGKAPSSLTQIKNCHTRYFVVGIVNNPSASSSQGDGIHIKECLVDYCAYGIVNGGTQSRDFLIQNCTVGHSMTLFSNGTYGDPAGAPAPKIIGGQGGGCYKVFGIHIVSDLFSCSNFYTENIQLIGNISTSTAGGNNNAFISNCRFFQYQKGVSTQIPKIMNLTSYGSVEFNNCIIGTRKGIFNVGGIGYLTFNNCKFRATDTWNDKYYVGHNYSYQSIGSPLITMNGCRYQTGSTIYSMTRMNSYTYGGLTNRLEFSPSTRTILDLNNQYNYIRAENKYYIEGSLNLSNANWVDANTVILTINAGETAQFALNDLLFWQTNAYGGQQYTVPALIVTDINDTDNKITADCLFDPNDYDKSWVPDGLDVFICQREWAPGVTCTGNTTSGSANLTNVSDSNCLRVGDFIRGTNIPDKTRVTVINGNTVTLSKNATGTATAVKLYYAKIEKLITDYTYDVLRNGFVDGNDTTYGTSWSGNPDAPTMGKLYTKIESLSAGGHDPVNLASDANSILGLSNQELNLDNQNANTVFAGPTSGGAADPTFRSIIAADLPAASATARGAVRPDANTISVDANGKINPFALQAADGSPVQPVKVDNDGNLIVGTTTVGQNLTVNATYGSNIVTNGTFDTDLTGWTGTGWTWSAGTALAPGTTTALTQSAATVTVGTTYILTFDVVGGTAGTVTPSFGGMTMTARNYGSASYTTYGTATETFALKFTPTDTFNGAIDNVELKPFTDNTGDLTIGGDLTVHSSIKDGQGTKVMTIFRGKVGIGTTYPIYHFDVRGDINSTAGIRGPVGSFSDALFLLNNVELRTGNNSDYSIGYASATDTLNFADGSDLTTNVRMILNSSGNFGIGVTPTTKFHVKNGDNSIAITVAIDANQANVTDADTFMDFRSTTGSEGSIAGTAVAGTIAYNTFTGSHYTLITNRIGLEPGMLLEAIDESIVEFPKQLKSLERKEKRTRTVFDANGVQVIEDYEEIIPAEYYEASAKQQLFKSRICSTRGSKAAIGVYGGTDKEGRDMILSLGTGMIKVVNKGVNISIGDYLMSSDLPGYAELQVTPLVTDKPDDIYRNITIAKATQNIIWKIGETDRMIKCIYLGG